MLVLSQGPNGALCARSRPLLPSISNSNPNLFSNSRRPRLPSPNPRSPGPSLTVASPSVDAAPSIRTRPRPRATPFPTGDDDTVAVGDEGVPLEGVIQVEKPSASQSLFISRAQVALLAGGDVLCLLFFSAIGRLSHGFPVFDFETLRTADPFVAGWMLSAYFLGGYGDDGKGLNGSKKAIITAAKSWIVGIPLGIAIRTATSSHIPATAFMLVSMGSTGVLLIGWRALVSGIILSKESKKSDVYKRGSPFELLELLTSLIRRW